MFTTALSLLSGTPALMLVLTEEMAIARAPGLPVIAIFGTSDFYEHIAWWDSVVAAGVKGYRWWLLRCGRGGFIAESTSRS